MSEHECGPFHGRQLLHRALDFLPHFDVKELLVRRRRRGEHRGKRVRRLDIDRSIFFGAPLPFA